MKSIKLAAAVLVCGSILGATVASAADVTYPVSMTTQGDVNFVEDDSPEGGENPGGEKPDPEPETVGGALQLNYAPKLLFGTHKISTDDQTYNAQAVHTTENNDVPLYAKVTDKRGVGTGWSLSVKFDKEFINKDHQDSPLTGAEITLGNGEAIAKNGVVSTTAAESVKLQAGDSATILNASGETGQKGMGTHFIQWGTEEQIKEEATGGVKGDENRQVSEAVTLAVPGNLDKYVGQYETTLTWSLTDTPAKNII